MNDFDKAKVLLVLKLKLSRHIRISIGFMRPCMSNLQKITILFNVDMIYKTSGKWSPFVK